jgi:hypothetical protein
MSKAGKILSTLLLLLTAACSTKYAEVVPDTELSVTAVRADTQAPLEGATIYLYDSDTAFHQTISSVAAPSGFISSFTTDSKGAVLISGLKANVQYYVYAYYKDSTIIQGTYITLDNSAQEYVLKNNLPQGSITNITIAVKPSDGFVLFWTNESNSAALPIAAYVGNSAVGTILEGNAAPAPFQSGSVSARVRSGTLTVEGKSGTGCIWTNQVTVDAGTFFYYNLADCSVGTIAFYTDAVNTNVLPIQLTLNANDGIGTITSPVTDTPSDCNSPNLVTIARTPGNYTYQAISPNGNCVWNGDFTLAAGECNLIYLTQCN